MTGSTSAIRDAVLSLLEACGDDGLAPIARAGEAVLRRGTLPYDGQLADVELAGLVALMRRTMLAAPGVGLAAPQIGLPLAIAVVEDPGIGVPEVARERERPALPFRVLVNPVEAGVGDERVGFYEGCLSVPGYAAVVSRHRTVRLTGADETGAALDELVTGWPARIVQHEIDHLRGMLYLDRAELRSLLAVDGPAARWASEPHPRAAADTLGFPLPGSARP